MKKIFFTLIVLCAATAVKAQNEILSAILQTGDEVTMFTGTNAFVDAYNNAADEGSIITLSSGTFSRPLQIQKTISVYGAGWEENAEKGIAPTVINGYIIIGSPSVKLEGLFFNDYVSIGNSVSGVVLDRCRLSYLRYGANSLDVAPNDNVVRRCYLGGVNGKGNYGVDYYIKNLRVENCYLYDIFQGGGTQILFDHCIIVKGSRTYPAYYYNCILATSGVENNTTLKNCICIFGEPTADTGVGHTGCWFGVDTDNIFEGESGLTYDASRTFVLNDPDTYSGTDGMPVGISGGNYPWYKIPSTPIVKSLQLGLDGQMLDVTYEAETR